MIIEALILSIIVGLIRGGDIRKIRFGNALGTWLLLLGIVVEYSFSFLSFVEVNKNFEVILKYSTYIHIISYLIIFVGIVLNLRIRSLWSLLVGYGLNFISLATNEWTIPNLIDNSIEGVKFPILAYTIKFFEPYPLPKLLTLGDLIISFGIFAVIQELMVRGGSYNRGYRL